MNVVRMRAALVVASSVWLLAAATSAATPQDSGAPDALKADARERGRIEVSGSSGAESEAAEKVTISATSDMFEYRLRIEEVAGFPVKGVALSVPPLVDSKGRQHPLAWGSDAEHVKVQDLGDVVPRAEASSVHTVLFKATLPELGTYATTITPIWDGARHKKIALTVTRAKPALGLEVPEPPTVVQTGTLDRVPFTLTVREIDDSDASIDVPALVSLVQVRGSEPKKLFARGDLSVTMGMTLLGLGEVVKIGRRESRRFDLALTGLSEPGRYDATIRFASRDAPPVDRSVAIYLRDYVAWALLFIVVGVTLSWALRYWVLDEQPRVVQQEAVLGLIGDLNESVALPNLDEEERRTTLSVRRELRRLLEAFLRSAKAQDVERVKTMTIKVPMVHNWIVLRHSLRTVSANVRGSFEDELGVIEQHLDAASTTAATLGDDIKKMEGMPARIEKAIAEDLKKQTDTFVEDLKTAVDAIPQGDPLRARLTKLQARVEGQASPSEDVLAAAQGDYLAALVESLRARLATPPSFITADSWGRLRQAALQVLDNASKMDPVAGLRVYRIGYREYLLGLNTALKEKLDTAAKLQPVPTAALEPLMMLHQVAEANLLEGQLEQAAKAIEELQRGLPTLEPGGKKMNVASPGFAAIPVVGGLLASLFSRPDFHKPALETVEQIATRRIKRGAKIEIAVNVIIAAVALALGLKVLYVDDLTWGGWGAYLTASLWGLGLHQFAYGGVGSLFDKLVKVPPATAGSGT